MILSQNAVKVRNNKYISQQIAEKQFNDNTERNIKTLIHGKYLKINTLKNGH